MINQHCKLKRKIYIALKEGISSKNNLAGLEMTKTITIDGNVYLLGDGAGGNVSSEYSCDCSRRRWF